MTESCPLDKLVLLVEDNEATRQAVSLILESDGYQVMTAANGLNALDTLRQGSRPCVILLDLMMPVMDGWQFREEQRRDQALADIPVVVCTAADETRARSSNLEAAAYLSKPVEVVDLLNTIRRYC